MITVQEVLRHPSKFNQWSKEPFGFTPEEVEAIMAGIHARGDRAMEIFLGCHTALAFLLAFYYDTWWITAIVAPLGIGLFSLSTYLLPGSFLTRCIAGISLQIYVALHIYQLHGMPEMHFFFFTGFTMMLVYQDWLCMWPGAILIIGQHILFAVMHNAGAPLFFFPDAYVGFGKLFFHFGIALIHVAVCGAWAIFKRRQTLIFARQEADLREATVKAQDATRAKSAFLAMMSHEIRTPMNAVVGMTQLLLDTRLEDEQRYFAESVRRGADGLLSVINDVLDFSKIEARKLAIHLEPTDLRALLRDVVELFRPSASQKSLELSFDYPPAAWDHYLVDSSRIRQIVVNLVGNSIKYTDVGSIRLTAEVIERDGAHTVTLAVADTGVGIPDHLQSLLFQEFNQLDDTNTRRHGGTGLGLAITRNLAELMGGTISVTSVYGQGSRFAVTLPLEPCARLSEKDATTSTFATDMQASVLVAEDNLINRRVIEAFLSKLGCKVMTANNGAEAIQLFRANSFDILLMDCQMPEVDGYQATRRIRALEAANGTRIPIIALTANAMAGDREACLLAGMDDYLSKPLSLAKLATVLERWAPSSLAQTPIPPHQ